MKILFTDIFLRKTFDIINILKQHYDANCFIYTSSNVNAISKIKANLIYGVNDLILLRQNDNFSKDLLKLSRIYSDEDIVFLPIEESSTLNFLEFLNLGNTTHNFKFLLPNLEMFSLSRDKERLNMFCESNKVPSPIYISADVFENRAFRFPIIIKPKHGSGAEGIIYIEGEEGLQGLHIDFNKSFVQERLPNPKEVEAGFFLCDKGKLISYYGHKRIRTYPESGGVTVFSKCSNSLDIKATGSIIVEKLNWSGLLMIEFIFDEKDKTYKLIEINPRLWGSVMLSEFCGAEFLKKYIEIATSKHIVETKIKEETFIRWVFPYDVIYWIKNFSNPFDYFRTNNNTCYINFTYSSTMRSFAFVLLTYFSFSKMFKLFKSGK